MDPEKTLGYLEEAELQAESILSDRQEIIDLDRRRNSNREALRQLKPKTTNSRDWICIGNMFLRMPNSLAVKAIEKEQTLLDNEIKDLRNGLRTQVDNLNDLEGKAKTRGSDLVALDKDEWKAIKQTLI